MFSTSRRDLLIGSLLAGCCLPSRNGMTDDATSDLTRKLADLEARHGGRLGAALLDSATGRLVSYRGAERFTMCSTFKFLASAFVLARVDQGIESLGRRIIYSQSDLVSHSPVTQAHADGVGMTVAELCTAAMTESDNTAANLLLDTFGGPAGMTAYLRSIGDSLTRLDRREPDLNDAIEGDPRDTTSPVAMLNTMNKVLLGDGLSAASRNQLADWMIACKTGNKRLRAGLPQGWRVGDKTGTGNHDTANDIAIIWPPERAPILASVFYTQFHASDEQRDAIFSDIGRIAISV